MKNNYMSLQGWLTVEQAALIKCLLDFQSANNIAGNIGEFGVFHGRSLSLLSNFIKPNEKLFGVDFLSDENEIINLFKDINFTYIKDYNFNLIRNTTFTDFYRTCRFLHIDSGHSAQEVFNNLEYAHNLLTVDGIVVIDDLFVYKHPQVTEAIFNYLFTYPHRFKIVICGFEKAVLCRPDFFTKLYMFATNNLQGNLINEGIQCGLCKSSSLGDSTIVSILRKKLGTFGDLYEHKIDKIVEEKEINGI